MEILEGGDPVKMACLMRSRTELEDDAYLDLEAEPQLWLKVETSGSRQVAFGSEILFGGPALLGENGIDEDFFYEASRISSSSEEPALIQLKGKPAVIVDIFDDVWYLRGEKKTAKSAFRNTTLDMGDFGKELENDLGLKLIGDMRIGRQMQGYEHEYYFSLGPWRVVVPVVAGQGVLNVGVETYGLLDVPSAEVPDGWLWRGWDPWSNSWIGEHLKSGVLARFS